VIDGASNTSTISHSRRKKNGTFKRISPIESTRVIKAKEIAVVKAEIIIQQIALI